MKICNDVLCDQVKEDLKARAEQAESELDRRERQYLEVMEKIGSWLRDSGVDAIASTDLHNEAMSRNNGDEPDDLHYAYALVKAIEKSQTGGEG